MNLEWEGQSASQYALNAPEFSNFPTRYPMWPGLLGKGDSESAAKILVSTVASKQLFES